jgi:hypothetical protein
MRYSFLALAVAAAVGGFTLASCGKGGSTGPDMGPDMATVALPDMAAPKLNCLGIGNCVLQCYLAGMGDISSCYNTTCMKQGKPGSAAKWANAFTCGQDYCDPPSDMLGECIPVKDPAGTGPTYLCDPGQTYDQCKNATTPGVCSNCLANARNLIWGDFSTNPPSAPTGMCPNPAATECKGGAMCMGLMNSCIGDP